MIRADFAAIDKLKELGSGAIDKVAELGEGRDVLLLNGLRRERRDRNRHVLDALPPVLGGDHDLPQLRQLIRVGCGGFLCGSRCAGAEQAIAGER